MPDLFISYNSKDEIWAKRFFEDVRSRFPTIKPFWARDTASIPPGSEFRPIFQGAVEDATNFVVFWSNNAKQSSEVLPEIATFLQSQKTNPKSRDGSQRTAFYVPLEAGVQHGTLNALQGFPDFGSVYDAADKDRGIAGLNAEPAKDNWSRMVRAIGNSALQGQASQAVTLALMVLTTQSGGSDNLDGILDYKPYASQPSLGEFLQSARLPLAAAKARYGKSAFDWKPFGTTKTIIDLAEDVREKVNADLDATHQFHWRPVDFVAEAMQLPDWPALQRLLEKLSDGPSIVVTDPVSLFNTAVQNIFRGLDAYAKKQQSMIVSISPVEAEGTNQLYSSLLGNSRPVLNAHLFPKIIDFEPAAFCGLDIRHAVQVERLIRNGLGYYYFQKKRRATNPLLTPGS